MNSKEDPVVLWIRKKLLNNRGKGPFTDPNGEQLWFWQGRRRIDIKESLGIDIPAVYGPPNAKILEESQENGRFLSVWQVEVEPGITRNIRVSYRDPNSSVFNGFVVGVFEKKEDEKESGLEAFERKVVKEDLVAVSILLAADSVFDIECLSEIYLNMGSCYGGLCVAEIIRVIDHMEHQYNIDGEPIILVAEGRAASLAILLGAIDKRVSAIVVDYNSSFEPLLSPTAKPPLYRDIYKLLGPQPWLVVAQCCIPKPLVVIGRPANADGIKLSDSEEKIFSGLDEQLKILKSTYKGVGAEKKLLVIDSAEDITQILREIAALL